MIPEKITVNLAEGSSHNIRFGTAAPEHIRQGVKVRGDFKTVTAWLEHKEIDYADATVYVDIEKGSIQLCTLEDRPTLKSTITGYIKPDSRLDSLGINTGKMYTPKQLSETLRINRTLFADIDDNMALVRSFRKFRAKIDKEIIEEDDSTGNKKYLIEQKIETEIPQSFNMSCPIIQNGADKDFKVDILAEVTSNAVSFYLDSIELREIRIADMQKILDLEVNGIKELFPDVAIIYHV